MMMIYKMKTNVLLVYDLWMKTNVTVLLFIDETIEELCVI